MNNGIFHIGHGSGRRFRRTGGFSLVSAIFLLVILAGLGVAVVSIFNAQQTGSSMDVQGERAYQAARAGLEWGMYQRLQPATSTYCDSIPAGTTTSSFTLPAGSSLSTFTVTVQCTYQPGYAVATTALSANGTTVTATTAAAHNFLPGAQIAMHNAVPVAFNTASSGATVIATTTSSPYTFTYVSSASGTATTQGTATAANMDRWLLVATACNQPITGWTATTVACPNSAPTSPDYVQRTAQAQL